MKPLICCVLSQDIGLFCTGPGDQCFFDWERFAALPWADYSESPLASPAITRQRLVPYSQLLGLALPGCWEHMIKLHELNQDPKSDGAGSSSSLNVGELVDLMDRHDNEQAARIAELEAEAEAKRIAKAKIVAANKARVSAEGLIARIQVGAFACPHSHPASV
jgi:hypothetical protein